MKKILLCLIMSALFAQIYAFDSLTVTVSSFDSAGVKITGDAGNENIKSKITIDDLKNAGKIIVVNKCDSNINIACGNYHNQLKINVAISSGHDSDMQKTIRNRQPDFYFYKKVKMDFLQNKKIFDSLIFNNSSANTSANLMAAHSQSDSAVTGIPFYDALSINYKDEVSMQQIKNIVSILAYYHDTTGDFSWGSICSLYVVSNPFIKDFLGSIDTSCLSRKPEKTITKNTIIDISSISNVFSASSVITSAFSSLGGLDVTDMADGMAKFLVKRTKREMAVAFFEKFKKAINDDKYKDMQILFPATCLCLSAIGDQIYNYDAYILALRESFEKDLKSLLDNMPSVISNHKEINDTDKALINSGLYFAKSIKNSIHPGRIIRDFPVCESEKVKDLSGVIEAIKIISGSIRDTGESSDSASYWVNPSQMQKLLSDSTAFKIYLGLIYQQASSKKAGSSGKELCRILNYLHENQGKYDRAKEYLADFCNAADNLSAVINSHKKDAGDSAKIKYLNDYINLSVDLIKSASTITSIVSGDHSDSMKKIDTMFSNLAKASGIATSMFYDIKRKNYSSAIINTVSLYRLYIAVSPDSSKFAMHLLKYGTFMATLVQASNSDEVEKTIEAFALPSGSASLKRHAVVDISLNAYTGMFWGMEKEISEGTPDIMNEIGGVNAPIGFAFSTSKWLIPCSWWLPNFINYISTSKTLFISVVDIGAVTAYRFKNDSVANLPQLKFENIIAPGAHLVFGLKDLPVSIGGGVQYGPQLRSVSDSAAVNNKIHGYRWNIFAAVDIPLWNIYSRQKEE